MSASARLLLLPLLASMTLGAAECLRNPFWPKGYEGERTPISAEVRPKPKSKPKPQAAKVDPKAAAAEKAAKEAAAKKDAAAKEALAREAAAKEAAAKDAAAKAAAEKAAREAAEKAEAERKREITSDDWREARKALKIGNPAVFKAEDGTIRSSININGNIYVDGDYMSFSLKGVRFTWRVQGLDGVEKKLRLVRIRARRGNMPPTEVRKTPPKSVFEDGLFASGSGFLVTTNGYLVTNHHVIEGARRVNVLCGNSQIYVAEIVKSDWKLDVALLKIDGTFTPIKMSDSYEERLGATVFTMGFPKPQYQGFEPKVTKGVISANEGFKGDRHLYQIDAAIQPGNSGGPAADENGRLVGVVVASLVGSRTQNVNYIIKKSYLLPFLDTVPACSRYVETAVDKGPTKFEDAVEAVQKSCVQIFVYQ